MAWFFVKRTSYPPTEAMTCIFCATFVSHMCVSINNILQGIILPYYKHDYKIMMTDINMIINNDD